MFVSFLYIILLGRQGILKFIVSAKQIIKYFLKIKIEKNI